MKTCYALMNPEGKFWDGNVPLRLSGQHGVVAFHIWRWQPVFRNEPKTFKEVRALDRRWEAYERMREVHPNLPRLTKVPVRISHQVLEGEETFEPTKYQRIAARIELLYGQNIGDSWLHGEYGREARFYYNGYLPEANFPNHPPEKWGVFLTEDERILLRLIDPKARVIDVADALGDEPLTCETTDPEAEMKQRFREQRKLGAEG